MKYSFTPGMEENYHSLPLVLFVHGRAGNISVMSTFKRCIEFQANFLFVEAPIQDPIGGYSWWLVGEEKDKIRELAINAALNFEFNLKKIFKDLQLIPVQLIGLGFSQGAALLSILLQRGNISFNKLGFLAGFVFKLDNFETKNISPQIFISHGTQDEVVSISKAQEGVNYLQNLGYQVSFHTDDVGHKVGSGGIRELKEWLGG